MTLWSRSRGKIGNVCKKPRSFLQKKLVKSSFLCYNNKKPAQNGTGWNFFSERGKLFIQISEELDKVTGKTGALNIALGIISIVGGIATGVLLLVHGGKLLRERRNIY